VINGTQSGIENRKGERMENYKEKIMLVEKQRDLVFSAEAYLWKHPETGYREKKTGDYMAEQFKALGYELTMAENVPGFYTDIDTGNEGPKVMVMCELDALACPNHPDADPQTGAAHACGHHAQCAAMLGLAAALKEPGALDGLSGSIRLMAVPSEEDLAPGVLERMKAEGRANYASGKVEFLSRGMMDDVDMTFLVHGLIEKPGRFLIRAGSNGCISKHITFHGKAAHAGSVPHLGLNALYAANTAITAMNALRETFQEKDQVRLHFIISNGGSAANIVPDQVEISGMVRAASVEAITEVNRRVNRAVCGAAASMGVTVTIEDNSMTMPLTNDRNLMNIAHKAAAQVVAEEELILNFDHRTSSCTDMGDMCSVMPAIQLYCSGAAGTSHGSDWRVLDRESLCMNSAKCQMTMLQMLLENNAEEARKVVREKRVPFAEKKDLLDVYDRTLKQFEGVRYHETGAELCY